MSFFGKFVINNSIILSLFTRIFLPARSPLVHLLLIEEFRLDFDKNGSIKYSTIFLSLELSVPSTFEKVQQFLLP